MKLTDLSINQFVDELASKSPAPGGGSVAALAGGLSAALSVMVIGLTLGKEKYASSWAAMEEVKQKGDQLAQDLLLLVDEDTRAYNGVIEAYKLPKSSDAEKTLRSEVIQKAVKGAALTPLRTLRKIWELTALAEKVLSEGNPNCITDAGVAFQMARAGALGAAYNVRVNLPGISDKAFREKLESETTKLLHAVLEASERAEETVDETLGTMNA